MYDVLFTIYPTLCLCSSVCVFVSVYWISSITIVSCNAQQNSLDVQALHKSNLATICYSI